MQRRKYLTGVAVAIIPFAGCGGLVGPDPRVTDSAAGQSFSDALTGSGEIQVALVNDGQSGDVEIELVFEDGSGTVVGRETHVISMGEGENRRESISVNIPNGAERYRAEAEAA